MRSVGIYSSSSALLLTWGVHKAEIIIISEERLIRRSHPAAEMVPLVEDVPHTLVVLLPLGLMHNDLTKRRFQSRSTQQLLPNRLNGWSNVHALCTANPVPISRLQILFYLSMWVPDSTWWHHWNHMTWWWACRSPSCMIVLLPLFTTHVVAPKLHRLSIRKKIMHCWS